MQDGTGPQFEEARDIAVEVCDAAIASNAATWLDWLVVEVFRAAATRDRVELRKQLTVVYGLIRRWVAVLDDQAGN